MARSSLPPGFRFHPTDVELVLYYLKRKVLGKKLRINAIAIVDIYKFAPWDLPALSCMRTRDLEWYFFCPRDKKHPNGSRTNRATKNGFWKTTGNDRQILCESRCVGMKKTLVFHAGRAPHGTRTDWVIHEYRLEDKCLADAGIRQDAFVVCRLFKKSGPGPKNGEQYGAPFVEEEWGDSDDEQGLLKLPLPDVASSSHAVASSSHAQVIDAAEEVTQQQQQQGFNICEQRAPHNSGAPDIQPTHMILDPVPLRQSSPEAHIAAEDFDALLSRLLSDDDDNIFPSAVPTEQPSVGLQPAVPLVIGQAGIEYDQEQIFACLENPYINNNTALVMENELLNLSGFEATVPTTQGTVSWWQYPVYNQDEVCYQHTAAAAGNNRNSLEQPASSGLCYSNVTDDYLCYYP